MGEKRINFRKIIKGIKRQGIRMQQRLIVYWCVVILTLFFSDSSVTEYYWSSSGNGFLKVRENVVCPAEEYVVSDDRADRHYDGEKYFFIGRYYKRIESMPDSQWKDIFQI